MFAFAFADVLPYFAHIRFVLGQGFAFTNVDLLGAANAALALQQQQEVEVEEEEGEEEEGE